MFEVADTLAVAWDGGVARLKYSLTIDVPCLDEGLRFYQDTFGFVGVARPVAGYAVLSCGDCKIGLIEKSAGSKPAKGSDDFRRYERHWTPVHIDFHVEHFEQALQKALSANGKCEQKFEATEHPPVAFCCDPFGNGFCIIGKKSESSRAKKP